jgi:N-methylhydantoinase A
VIVHGTTVATNALIQGSGAKTALLCTEGFRDSLEIRQGYKEERYDLDYPPPRMLVPRYLRRGIVERVDSDGRILVDLDEDQVRAELAFLREQGVEAVAVALLWSFLNPAHERRIGELLREELPEVFQSLSVDVLPQIREYDRTSTTVVNAFVGPILERYVRRIQQVFASKGAPGAQIRFMQVNAGIASAEALLRRPLYALNSGPAAGPTAGLHFGAQVGTDNIIVADMGGTSFDVCLAQNGLPDTAKGIDVCRYRLGIPMINVHTVGAGGGSIAWLDRGGLLHVGPQSAQAVPGPVCYGRGGTEPTVTDANVVLGYLGPQGLLGGRLALDTRAAADAVAERIAAPAGLSTEAAAHGIFEVVNHNMALAIREMTVERGYDPRDFAVVAGGGACGIHVGRLATELGAPRVIVPKVAPALCAFGEVVADLRHDFVSSFAIPTPLRDLDAVRLNELLRQLERQGREQLGEEGIDPGQMLVTRSLDMRYRGQVHECDVQIDGRDISAGAIPEVEELFHRRHEALYTYADRGGVCELVSVGVSVRGRGGPSVDWADSGQATTLDAARVSEREIYLAESAGFESVPVYGGPAFPAGIAVDGPCVIEEPTTAIVVFPGSQIVLDTRGFYVMTVGEREW